MGAPIEDRPRRPLSTAFTDRDLGRRALAAYYRTENRAGVIPDAPSGWGDVVEHQGLTYVVLANSYRTLAVYRVRTSGQLKRLRRWPKEVAD
jgi:hypothetical protein